jgi:uncharacterized repeat protein (TIGR03803 family)
MKQLANLAGACLSAALLAACGGPNGGNLLAQPTSARIAEPVRAIPLSKKKYESFFSFDVNDGMNPNFGSLLDIGGKFYGTTAFGGAYDQASGGGGTVFSVTTNGTEAVLHSFGNGKDGLTPYAASLVKIDGDLYGTTAGGGANNFGTVFSITESGTEKVLYSFKGGEDGAYPYAGLIALNGVLYGTTFCGGTHERGSKCVGGTVFSVSTRGKENVIFNFGSGNDGANPQSSLFYADRMFYGTTDKGGSVGGGTVFSLTPTGSEHVLHSFCLQKSCTDGYLPRAPVIVLDGTLYGTAAGGGAYEAGIAYSINASGAFQDLHDFGNGSDGIYPNAGFVVVNGILYSTTDCGGLYNSSGCVHGSAPGGTIFSLSTSGSESAVYSFGKKSTDGAQPFSTLIAVKNTLYGTTLDGGAYDGSKGGAGTVFALKL